MNETNQPKEEQTSIRISFKLWKKLKDLKKSPKDSFEKIIWELLKN